MRTQELSFGFEHQLSATLAATVRYVRKNLDRAIDDVGDLDPDGNEAYIIANPGEGLVDVFDISSGQSVFKPQEPGGVFPANAAADHDARRRRASTTASRAASSKRLSNQLDGTGSYTWSRDAGNYSGLSSSDENGPRQPEQLARLRLPVDVVRRHGQGTRRRARHRPHAPDQGVGALPVQVGHVVRPERVHASGTPITRQVPVIAGSNYPIRYLGPRTATAGRRVLRRPICSSQHGFKVGGARSIQLSQRAEPVRPAHRQQQGDRPTPQRSDPERAGLLQEAAFYAGQLNFDDLIARSVASGLMTLNPQFLMANGYQAPIPLRSG